MARRIDILSHAGESLSTARKCQQACPTRTSAQPRVGNRRSCPSLRTRYRRALQHVIASAALQDKLPAEVHHCTAVMASELRSTVSSPSPPLIVTVPPNVVALDSEPPRRGLTVPSAKVVAEPQVEHRFTRDVRIVERHRRCRRRCSPPATHPRTFDAAAAFAPEPPGSWRCRIR